MTTFDLELIHKENLKGFWAVDILPGLEAQGGCQSMLALISALLVDAVPALMSVRSPSSAAPTDRADSSGWQDERQGIWIGSSPS